MSYLSSSAASTPTQSAFVQGARADYRQVLMHHDEAASDCGGVVVLGGPRGVGKGTLLSEMRRELSQAGRLVLFGRGELASAVPYGALKGPASQALAFLESRGLAERFFDDHARALGVLLPGLAPPQSAQRARDKMAFFEDLRAFFIDLAAQVPLTLLLADLHHADDDTRDVIRFLAAHLFVAQAAGRQDNRDFKGVLIVSARTDEPESSRLVAGLTEDENVIRMDVAGLSREDLLTYLSTHSGLQRLLDASHGRPDDVDALLTALPDDANTFFLQRIQTYPASHQKVLHALSVLGHPSPPDVLAGILGAKGAQVGPALSALVEQGVLARRLKNGELLFAYKRPHQEEVVMRALHDDERKKLHEAIADHLASRSAFEPMDQTLAHHYLSGAHPERGVQNAQFACERLLLTFAYSAAADLATRALAVTDEPGVRLSLLSHLVEARKLRGELRLALDAAEEMRKVAAPHELPAVLRRVGELSSARGENRYALKALQEALTRLEDGDERTGQDEPDDALPERALVRATMAEVAYAEGELDAAINHAHAADACAPDAPVAFRLRVANTLGKIDYSREEFEKAGALFLENFEKAEQHGLEHEAMLAQINTGLARFRLGQNEDARAILERALISARAVGDVNNEAHALQNIGAISIRVSDLGVALNRFRSSLSLFSRLGNRTEIRRASWNLANTYVALGDYAKAEVWLNQSRRLAEVDGSTRGRAFVRFSEGDLCFDQGQHTAAVTSYEKAREIFAQLGEASRVVEMTVKAVWSALYLGDVEAAQRRIELLPAGKSEIMNARVEAVRGATLALSAEVPGSGQDALDGLSQLSRAVDIFLDLQIDEDAWRSLAFLVERFEARGDEKSAAAAREQCCGIIRGISERLPENLETTYLSDPLRRTLLGLRGAPPSLFPQPAPKKKKAASSSEARGSLARSHSSQIDAQRLRAAHAPKERRQEWDERYPEFVGRSPSLCRVFDRLDRVARTKDATVLIRGESGTGKELVAAAVHRVSNFSSGPFVRVNCAALVETLLLSELFGHEKGSFTGAFSRKIGRFEMARGGTIFLDEIGDISQKTQVSLLRVLQERSFERVGGTQTITTDAQVICATHRNLENMVKEGTFREDLYYRLRGLIIEVPALRERPEDIPSLIDGFLDKSREDLGRAPHKVSSDAREILTRYPWPGNIRELQNVVRSVALFCEGDEIEPVHLAEFPELFDPSSSPVSPSLASAEMGSLGENSVPEKEGTNEVLRRVGEQAHDEGLALGDLKRRLEFEAIADAIRRTSGNITRAAELLKMKRPRLSQIVNGDPKLKVIKEESRTRR
ncbi:MAG: AAA family ATPase [Deltaproteobacteria bacterium]|nr:AAA family ATPase [Deltaproteobacteria bacterium]